MIPPFEPEREAPKEAPAAAAAKRGEARTGTTKIRTRWYPVRIALYRLPNLPIPPGVDHAGRSSGTGGKWLRDEDSNLEPSG
jgi:hypothetical protein